MQLDAPAALIADLLAFVGREGRELDAVLDAWRTSCPRLPVWETALDGGMVALKPCSSGTRVVLTRTGLDFLAKERAA